MNDIDELKIFSNTGMDTDADLLAIQGGDSRYRLNVTLNEDGNSGVLSTVKGNVVVSNTLPSGTNKIIGFVEDKDENAGIYFIYNSDGYHSIFRYFADGDTTDCILRGDDVNADSDSIGSILNFQDYVDASIIGNGNNKYLAFVDSVNEPKLLNVSMAANYTLGSGTPAYDDITEELIKAYKKPYIGSIIVSDGGISTEFTGNNIKNKIFQFALRLKYYDGTYSTSSAYSNVINTVDNMPSGRTSDEDLSNTLSVSLSFDNDFDLVSEYQLLYRNLDTGESVAGSWNIYEDYDYTTTTEDVTIDFFNDQSLGIITDEEMARPYDYVPQIANHIGVIDDNRLVYGGITESFDNVDDFDVVASATITTIDSADNGIYYSKDDFISAAGTVNILLTPTEALDDDHFYTLLIAEFSSTEIADVLLEYANQENLFTQKLNSSYDTEAYDFNSTYQLLRSVAFEDFESSINSDTDYDVTATYSSLDTSLTIEVDAISTNTYYVSLVVLEKTATYKTLKTGATYKYGIRYGFGGRIGYTQTSDDMVLDTDGYHEITDTINMDYIQNARININHLAPDGATDYQVVSFGSDVDAFEQYLVSCDFDDIESYTLSTMYTDGTDTIINRSAMISYMQKAYNDDLDYGIDVNKGDELNIIGYFKRENYSDVDVLYVVERFTDEYKYTINSVSTDQIRISLSGIKRLEEYFNDEDLADTKYLLIELVRKKDFDSTPVEFSPVFSIDPLTNRHEGDQAVKYGLPAYVDVTTHFADVYKTKQVFVNNKNIEDYGRTSTNGVYCWMDKQVMSLNYDSTPDVSNYGRENVVVDSASKNSYNKIRWGGVFVDTAGDDDELVNYNFLTKFEFANEKSLDDRNGDITKIQQIGNTLVVNQERKVSSFYLKTTASTDANGETTYLYSDDVMSDSRQMIEDFGCTHFSSYVKNVRNAYFFDLINGAVIRHSANGLTEVSKNKMKTYFRQKAEDIKSYDGDVSILGGWDVDLSMYIITFIDLDDLDSSINETLGFYEDENRWVSFYSYLPEYYGQIGSDVTLAFRDGLAYKQNRNETRNYFFGEQFYSEVWIHSNDQPQLRKIYDSIEINSKNQWYCPDNDSIVIERPISMQSRLKSGKFKIEEGVYKSEFLKDMLSGGSTAQVKNLLNGRELRGREMTVKLRNVDTDQSLLETVSIKSSISK